MCRYIAKYAVVMAVLTLCLVPVGRAQAFDGTYMVDIFQNVTTLDGLHKVVNDGFLGDTSTLCDDVYVFHLEQLTECCSCPVTANGSMDYDVKKNFDSNNLTGKPFPELIVKEISSAPPCDPTAATPTPGLHGWSIKSEVVGALKNLTETVSPFADLSAAELADLDEDCKVLIELGSGAGICSCGIPD